MTSFDFQISVILLLLAVCIYLYMKIESSRPVKLFISLGMLVSFVFYTFYGVANYFTGNGITGEAVYYVNYGLSGAGFSEYQDLIAISILSLVFGVVFSLWIFFKGATSSKTSKHYLYLVLLLVILSLIFNPVTAVVGEIISSKLEKPTFDKNSDFYTYYKTPEIRQTSEPKNLMFIYAEGLERTFFNESVFPGLTENLNKIESESISFTNTDQDWYALHTMGGLVASQCGFPLIAPAHGNTMGGMDRYLDSAICLGDLLHKADYYLAFYGGASLDFGGKGKFFSTHKFDEIYGVDQLLPKIVNKSYVGWWGIYDDSLFDLAYNHFVKLSKTQEKFAMFLLTLDTHPEGLPSKSCDSGVYSDANRSMLNAVACSDYLIAKFIRQIRQSGFGNNTVIVLVSDHFSMTGTVPELNEMKRSNLFIINEPNSTEEIKIDKWATNMDITPTILPFIGYEGNIGLGRDIINRNESDSQIKDIQNNLTNWKQYILQFWDFPKIEKSIEIDTKQRKTYIDNRPFNIPVLIELNDELETSLKFDVNVAEEMQKNTNTSFILIESCQKTNELFNKTINYPGFCILAGKGSKYHMHMILADYTEFSTKDIRKITGLD